MPFVPRSQLEQKQQAAAPPPMPVVENFQAKQHQQTTLSRTTTQKSRSPNSMSFSYTCWTNWQT